MNIFGRSLFFALTMLTGVAHANNLISNGSFETGSFPTSPLEPSSAKLLPASTVIDGWRVSNSDIAWIGQGNNYGLTAAAGNRFLDLTGWTANGHGAVSQTISTTAGTHYTLTFDLGNSRNFNGAFGVPYSALIASAGKASSVFTNTDSAGTNSWQRFTFDFVAAGSSTDISFRGYSAQYYIGLDNVTVAAAVPEPETYALLVAGIGLLGTISRRKRRAA